MQNLVNEAYKYKAIAASANVMPRSGALCGIFVANGSGNITIYDSAATDTNTKIVDAFSVIPGTFYPLPFLFESGLYIVISGGSMNITVALQGN